MWRTRSPKTLPVRLKKIPAPFVIIAHTAMAACYTEIQCAKHVRSIQIYHMETKGWNDIGYNFLVGGNCNVYEDRGWDIEGAHTYGWNNVSIGIAFMGTFTNIVPEKCQIQAALKLIESGVKTGKISRDYKLLGHRQCRNVESTGQKLYEIIQTWDHWEPTYFY